MNGSFFNSYYIMTNIDKNAEKKKFDKIITDIETVLDCGWKVPPFGAVVSAKEIRKQLATLQKAVSDSVEEAEHIVAVKEKILTDARAEAEELIRRRQIEISKQPILKEAENIAKKMLLQAKEEAEKMVRQAQEFQQEIKERTYRYADMVFNELDRGLSDKRKDIMQNRQQLKALVEAANNPNANNSNKEETAEPKRKLS